MITSWYQVYVRFRLESLLQTYIVINQERTYSYYSTDLREFELTGRFGFFFFFSYIDLLSCIARFIKGQNPPPLAHAT